MKCLDQGLDQFCSYFALKDSISKENFPLNILTNINALESDGKSNRKEITILRILGLCHNQNIFKNTLTSFSQSLWNNDNPYR